MTHGIHDQRSGLLHRGLLIGRMIRHDHTTRWAEVRGALVEGAEEWIDGVASRRTIQLIEAAAG